MNKKGFLLPVLLATVVLTVLVGLRAFTPDAGSTISTLPSSQKGDSMSSAATCAGVAPAQVDSSSPSATVQNSIVIVVKKEDIETLTKMVAGLDRSKPDQFRQGWEVATKRAERLLNAGLHTCDQTGWLQQFILCGEYASKGDSRFDDSMKVLSESPY